MPSMKDQYYSSARTMMTLGGKALLVEHIGSTSEPGLYANPKPSEVRTEQIIYIRKGS
ncbi:hypothetical protein DEAC_c36820 [Desulfosporosinus acididurans]|uniref:Uncharacterized protein n=1 Tax=Desulfosporosinus acididurans TaxID=476652 RepID=A0A0J1FLY9_9FIRM|nr:GrpB family protein [Desulfosporosinus acididurans]KLU64480.1 hypothetical protein DEAC_c36820 [Desulfosporosinus acididurans]